MKDPQPSAKARIPLPVKIGAGLVVWIALLAVVPILVAPTAIVVVIVLLAHDSGKRAKRNANAPAQSAFTVRVTPTAIPAPVEQTVYSTKAENDSEMRMLRDRRFRGDFRGVRSDGDAQTLYRRLAGVPLIADALGGSVPSLRIVGRHTTGGVEIAGSLRRLAHGGVQLTVGRDSLTPTTMLHELAHYAAGLDAGHGPTWAETYRSFVRAAYPGKQSARFAA